MVAKRYLSITVLILLLFFGESGVQPYEIRTEEVTNNPTVTYVKDFTVDVPVEIWNKILDNPSLMGSLWELYKFQPAYKVTTTDFGYHVVDPTGIIGDIRQVGQSDRSRIFYGNGRFHHWAIPSFFAANGVIIFEYKMDRDRLLGEMKIFMRGENRISRLVMIITSGILTSHVGNRFKNNMEDVKKLARDIVTDPDKIKKSLAGTVQDDFIRCFQ
jgi:hypothetical protein